MKWYVLMKWYNAHDLCPLGGWAPKEVVVPSVAIFDSFAAAARGAGGVTHGSVKPLEVWEVAADGTIAITILGEP